MKAILFGIQLVLLGALCSFTLGPAISLLISASGRPLSSMLLALGPLIGLTLAIIGAVIGWRGYTSAE